MTVPIHEARLGFLSSTLLWRLVVGAPFAAAWMAAVLTPITRHIESDLPLAMIVGALVVASVTPVVLYLRRHALDASVRWSDDTITLVRGGRVETSLAWCDAVVRTGARGRHRVVQIADGTGRTIGLATGSVLGGAAPTGRRRIEPAALDALLAVAGTRSTLADEPPQVEPETALARACALVSLVTIAWGWPRIAEPRFAALAFAAMCALLLVGPVRRLLSATKRPVGREALFVDTEERGRMRARRLDGSRVLLDVASASHPDARLSAKRGIVHAVLAIPSSGTGTPYRALDEAIPATFVETRDDRVLRFEHVRAALVDVIGYGTFFATAVAAALVG